MEIYMKKFILIVDNIVFKFWLIFMASVFGISLVFKAMYNMDDSPYFEFTKGIDILLLVGLIGVYFFIVKHHDLIEKIPYIVLIIFGAAVAVIFICILPIYPISDPQYVTDGALMMANGDINAILASDYLQTIVQNLKMSAFYAAFIIFLPKTFISLRIVNVVFYLVTAVCCGKICKNIVGDYDKTAFVLTASFIPMILYTNQVYFDFPILCLGTVAVYFYTKEKKLSNIIISGVLLGIAGSLRVLAYIFAIAILVDLIFDQGVNRHKVKKTIVYSLIFIGIVFCIPKGTDIIINHFFRAEGAQNGSAWFQFWMGINEEEFGMMHNEIMDQGTSATFKDFWDLLTSRNLKQNLSLFGRKILWTWTQGTYQCQRYGLGYDMTVAADKYLYQTFLTNKFMISTQIIPCILINVARAQYMALFFFATLGVFKNVKDKVFSKTRVLVYLFFGTFLILIFFEMKARYIFHLGASMVILAIIGIDACKRKELLSDKLLVKRIIACVLIIFTVTMIIVSVIWNIDKDEQLKLEEQEALQNTVLDICERDGLTISERQIIIDGIDKQYDFLFLSDEHATMTSLYDLPAWGLNIDNRLQLFMNEKGVLSSDQFSDWVEISNLLNLDGMLLGGDIIDFGSDENAEWLREKLSELQIPYVYALGNHDAFDIMNNVEKPDNENIESLFVDCDDEFSYVDYGDFMVCAINDAYMCVSEEALNKFKNVYEVGKPIILIAHVPLCTPTNEELKIDTEKYRGEDRLIGPELDYQLDKTTEEFYNMVLAESSPIVAVLSGHVHFGHDDMLMDRIPQFIIGDGSSGEAYIVHVKSSP